MPAKPAGTPSTATAPIKKSMVATIATKKSRFFDVPFFKAGTPLVGHFAPGR